MIKTTGAEWKKFYTDPEFWPDGTWHEDEEITVNGVFVEESEIDLGQVSDSDVLKIKNGVVLTESYEPNAPSLEAYFKRWRKKQSTIFLSVECNKDVADAVLAAILAAGGKVIGGR